MAKSELELEEERRLAENRKATQSKGIGSEILDKIKNNPWKTLGTVLLAAAFPAGTIIAGAIATGVVAKSGYDAHVNNKVNQGKGEVSSSTATQTKEDPKRNYSQKISPPSTPFIPNTNKSEVIRW